MQAGSTFVELEEEPPVAALETSITLEAHFSRLEATSSHVPGPPETRSQPAHKRPDA